MPNSPAPSAVLINSHSIYGFHKQLVATLEWFPETSSGGQGTFDSWAGSHVDADTMIKGLVTVLAAAMPDTYEYDNYIIFAYDTVDSPGVPVGSGALATMGSVSSPGWAKAVQATMTWRTSAFGLFKIVLLDVGSGGDFSKVTDPSASATLAAIHAEVIDDANGWSGRDNAQPLTFISQTKTLNEKLRRSYRMT